MADKSRILLSGRRLTFVKLVWLVVAILCTVLFVLSIPQKIQQIGLEITHWLDIILPAYFILIGIFIFWRRPDDWVTLIVSLCFITALVSDGFQVVFGPGPLTERFDLILAAISSTLLICIFYIFPDGHFVPRWTRWAMVLVALVQFWRLLFPDVYEQRGFPLMGLLLLTTPFALIYRYLRVADAVQRLQIKWVAFAVAVLVLPLGIAIISFNSSFWANESGDQLGQLFWYGFLFIFPLSIVFSILRYRLWDIDVIIRRTLIYGVLTVLLALVFFGGVVLLQRVFASLTGTENSPIAIVLSTLAIVALFGRLRLWVQDLIDRRFFRHKYDAEKILAAFAVTARDETDLDRLTGELVRVAQETMQPELASLWLKENDKAQAGVLTR